MSRYDAILKKLKEATGPSVTLNAEIALALHPESLFKHYSAYAVWRASPDSDCARLPDWCQSIDAALALVDERLPLYDYCVHRVSGAYGAEIGTPETFDCVTASAPTAPLAILIAFFEAMKAEENKA